LVAGAGTLMMFALSVLSLSAFGCAGLSCVFHAVQKQDRGAPLSMLDESNTMLDSMFERSPLHRAVWGEGSMDGLMFIHSSNQLRPAQQGLFGAVDAVHSASQRQHTQKLEQQMKMAMMHRHRRSKTKAMQVSETHSADHHEKMSKLAQVLAGSNRTSTAQVSGHTERSDLARISDILQARKGPIPSKVAMQPNGTVRRGFDVTKGVGKLEKKVEPLLDATSPEELVAAANNLQSAGSAVKNGVGDIFESLHRTRPVAEKLQNRLRPKETT
jgi:hypothetical protein